jgi:hypothetical protein
MKMFESEGEFLIMRGLSSRDCFLLVYLFFLFFPRSYRLELLGILISLVQIAHFEVLVTGLLLGVLQRNLKIDIDKVAVEALS